MIDRTAIEIAVLDLVGTTVAGNDIVRSAVARVAGDRFDPVVFHRFRGAPKREMLAALVGTRDAERAHTEFEYHLRAAIGAGALRSLPGAEQCLRDIKARGIRVCLITGFSCTAREDMLSNLGWDRLVDLALSPEDVRRGRPAPDLILTAALRLGATDVRAVAVAGDTTNDLVAAHRAGSGIRAGVLTGAHDIATLRAAPHTHILGRIGDLVPAIDQWAA
jgi:phosphoglycolate phosphatase